MNRIARNERIVQMHAEGVPNIEIAQKFKLSESRIIDICNGYYRQSKMNRVVPMDSSLLGCTVADIKKQCNFIVGEKVRIFDVICHKYINATVESIKNFNVILAGTNGRTYSESFQTIWCKNFESDNIASKPKRIILRGWK